MDEYAKIDLTSKRKELRLKLGIEGKRLIAYGGQVTPNNPETLRWVVENLGENDVLYFGMHPRDNRDYSEILKKAGDKLLTPERAKALAGTSRFDDLMPTADIVVTHYSTVGLTAAIMGIDVINVHVPGDEVPYSMLAMPNEYPLVASGASLPAASSAEYAEKINNLEKYEAKLAEGRKNYKAGFAGKKIAETIEQLFG